MIHVYVTLIALAAALQTPAPPAATLTEPLRAFEFVVGSCWTGTFPDGKRTDTHCFEPMLDGRFLRDRHVVRGGETTYAGETIYGWDTAQKKIVYTYWASTGGISTGAGEPRNGEIVFSENHVSGGKSLTIRTVLTRRDADRYDVVVSQLREGEWREMWTMTMRRDPR